MKKSGFYILLLIISLFLSGCSIKVPSIFKKEVEPVSSLPGSAILVNGEEIAQATMDLINMAQSSIYIEQVIFDLPAIKERLIEKAQSGVDVKIILDQWQTGNKAVLDELKSQNISIQFYPARKGQNHRAKLMVIDQNQALIYGPNWTEESMAGKCLALKLTEKSAWKAAYSVFLKDWKYTTTLTLDVPKTTTLPEDYVTLALDANVKQQVLNQIGDAESSIAIELSDLMETDTVAALIGAALGGKQVRVLLNQTSAPSTSQLTAAEDLKAGGVEIRYSSTLSSRQFAVIDQKSLIISSSGWTYSAFVINHELAATVPSPEAATRMLQLFEEDWQAAGSAGYSEPEPLSGESVDSSAAGTPSK